MIMNARFMSYQWIAFVFFGSLFCAQCYAQSVSNTACTITDQACPCSRATPSGSCMKNQGDEKCLLAICQPSYHCDCLGYEMCKKSACSVYTAVDGTIPSGTMAFGCHLTPGAGSCTTFDYVIDTVEAALNAKIDASNSNNEALIHGVNAQHLVTEVHSEDLLVNEELLTIDSVRDQMTTEEQDTIFSNARLIKDSVTRCARHALNISMEACQAYGMNLKTADFARSAIQAEKDGKNAEYKLEEEDSKAKKENRTCSVCTQLEEDIERLNQLRKDAAVNAGNSAKSCAKNKDTSSMILKDIHETRLNCGLARAKVLSEITKLKTRLGLS